MTQDAQAGQEHVRPLTGRPCPYLAAEGYCGKCGWMAPEPGLTSDDIFAAMRKIRADGDPGVIRDSDHIIELPRPYVPRVVRRLPHIALDPADIGSKDWPFRFGPLDQPEWHGVEWKEDDLAPMSWTQAGEVSPEMLRDMFSRLWQGGPVRPDRIIDAPLVTDPEQPPGTFRLEPRPLPDDPMTWTHAEYHAQLPPEMRASPCCVHCRHEPDFAGHPHPCTSCIMQQARCQVGLCLADPPHECLLNLPGGVVMHKMWDETGLTPCCRRSAATLPVTDKLAWRDDLVTCNGDGLSPEASAALQAQREELGRLLAAKRPEVEAVIGELRPCAKPDCPRLVSGMSAHCCGSCSAAAEGGYEIHEHSDGCNERDAVRRPKVKSRSTVHVELECGHGWSETRPRGMTYPEDGELRACGHPECYPSQWLPATYTEFAELADGD
jgi:hypothetical protein